MKHDPEANRRNAVDFYRTACPGNPVEAVDSCVGAEYIQHNPEVDDGKRGFIDYFDAMHRDFPDNSIDLVRVIAEGDMVALHTQRAWPDNVEYVTMDFFSPR